LGTVAKVIKGVNVKSSGNDIFSDEENLKINASAGGEYRDDY